MLIVLGDVSIVNLIKNVLNVQKVNYLLNIGVVVKNVTKKTENIFIVENV